MLHMPTGTVAIDVVVVGVQEMYIILRTVDDSWIIDDGVEGGTCWNGRKTNFEIYLITGRII